MITSCKLTGSAAKIAAYHASEENYYFSQAAGVEALSGETGGGPRIDGNLAAALGFKAGAAITQRDLENLLSSRNAAGQLVAREHKVIGIDLTFSAPKSVSVAGLLTDRDPAIIAAHDRAVLETMQEIERQCAAARPYIDGEQPTVPTGSMAYVTVRDGFNREHDPHLHTHVVVMNLTAYGNKIMALDGRQIMRYDFNKVWGALYRAKLAACLKEAGLSISYTKKGELRLDSVSLEVEREFSTRRAGIAAAKERGLGDMAAWRKTRKEKDPSMEKTGVLEAWQRRAERYKTKSLEQNRADCLAEREAWAREAAFSVEARQEVAGERGGTEAARWQAAARRATERTAVVSANVLITEYLTELARGEAWAPITYAEAEQRLVAEVNAGRLLATDDGRYTTWEMTRADRECVRERRAPAALALWPADADAAVRRYTTASLKAGQRGLSEQQAAVAAGILSAERGTVVVQGDAGAGKTTMLKAVKVVACDKGWETVGLAVQGVAARKLQEESGIPSSTIASYLAREREAEKAERAQGAGAAPRAPRLLVIDEASMCDSRGLAELMKRADRHGDKVVLVGDRNQIQSVGAGRPFDRLVDTAEASGQLLSLCENYRQRDKALRDAVDLARAGRMRESLDALARLGCVAEVPETAARRALVAARYDKDTLILAGSRASRDALNALIRADLVRRGVVDSATAQSYSLEVADEDGAKRQVEREFAKGDVVTFLKNDYRPGFDVRNGERGEVLKTATAGLTVRLEDGRTVEVDTKQYGSLDYGYAMTTYKSQGQTYNKVVVEADTTVPVLQDQRNTYVQITRARDAVHVFTDYKAELRDIAGVLNNRMDTFGVDATLEKAAAMERHVRAEVLEERAQREAEAKIQLAQAAAARELEVSSRLGQPPQPADGSEVANESAAFLREVEVALRARKDLSDGEKRWTSEYLGSAEAAKTLERFRDTSPAIAFGLVKARAMDLDEAIRDLPADQKIEVTLAVRDGVYNARLVADAGRLVYVRESCLAQLQKVDEHLRARSDLSQAERKRVAEYLAVPESARIFNAFMKGEPEQVVAAGLVGSGVRGLEEAARDLSAQEKMAVGIYLRNREIEKERGRQKERTRELDRGLDFGL